MRKNSRLFLLVGLLFVSVGFMGIRVKEFYSLTKMEQERVKFTSFINSHPFSNRDMSAYAGLSEEEREELEEQKDRPDLAFEQDFLMTMDPKLGRPARERLEIAYQMVKNFQLTQAANGPGGGAQTNSITWTERGPSNVGGRTRAIMFDPNDNTKKKVWAGGVGGGLWYTNDITVASPVWNHVDDFWDNIAITCIAFDPSNKQIFYVGTGEGWFNADAIRGAGIWKTTDGGATWARLASTENSNFHYNQKIVVANNGDVYVGTVGGVRRSTDKGTSWTLVNSAGNFCSDLEIGADGTIYSAHGRGGVNGSIYYSTNGTSWTKVSTSTGFPATCNRVEIACAPSNANILYAFVCSNNAFLDLYRSSDKGLNWTTLTKPSWLDQGSPNVDITRGQAWYDLSLAVDPNDPARVYCGGVDLFRTANSGSSWEQISRWAGASGNLAYTHADQHSIVFEPGSSSRALVANDGGVFLFTNTTGALPVVFTSKNTGYNVTQYYSCAQQNTLGSNYMLGGTQDNGTHKFTTAGINSVTEVTGGDGGFCFIDQDNPNIQVTSYTNDNYYRSTNGGSSFPQISSGSGGRFINPTEYDSKEKVLYAALSTSTIKRITGMAGSVNVGSFTVSGLGNYASAIKASPYSTTGNSTIFVGTEGGKLFKITNAQTGATPTATNITGSLPAGNISCVELGGSEDSIIVTYSNYGMNSVYYTSNGTNTTPTWINKDVGSSLPDMPVRWAIINPNEPKQVMIATEVGVWSTTNFDAAVPTWAPSNSGLANVRVDMLKIRKIDNQVIAATHGRGVFTTNAFASTKIQTFFSADKTSACPGSTINFTDNSLNAPTSWKWTFTGGTPSTSTAKNPSVTYSNAGSFKVKLVITKGIEKDSLEVNNYITISSPTADTILPLTEGFQGATFPPTKWTINNPNSDNTFVKYTGAGTGGFGQSSSSCYIFSSNIPTNGLIDELILPTTNINVYGNKRLIYSYSWGYVTGKESEAVYDTVKVFYQSICSPGWKVLKVRGGSNLVTRPPDNGAVTSPSNGWKKDTISLNDIASLGVIQLKFQFKNGEGSILFLDDIDLSSFIGPKSAPAFTSNKTSVCKNGSVTFTDQSNNNPTAWQWTFPGGTPSSSSVQNPSVVYSTPGTYNVTLKVTNETGDSTLSKNTYITVNDLPNTSAITGANKVCKSSTGSAYSVTNTTGSTYQWVIVGGTQATGTNTNSISVNWGANAGQGFVKVVETNSSTCKGDSVIYPVTIFNKPVTSAISGDVNVCANNDPHTYSVTNTPNSTYSWVVENGQIVSASTANTIQIKWPTVGTGKLKIVETNEGTCKGDTVSLTVNVLAAPSKPGLTGLDKVCANTNNVNYSTTLVSGLTYTWLVTGGTIASGSGTNSVNINWGTAGAGKLKLVAKNAGNCNSDTAFLNVDIQAKPVTSVISGAASICEGQQGVAYSVSPKTGSTFNWIAVGGTITSGQTTNAITLNAGTAGTIKLKVVESTSANCAGDTVFKTITVNTKPITSAIVGSDSVCAGTTGGVYSVTNKANTTYNWQVVNGTIVSGAGTNSISINFTAGAKTTISVSETNNSSACTSNLVTKEVIQKSANSNVSITGPVKVCLPSNSVLYVAKNLGGLSPTWTISKGQIVGGNSKDSILVNWTSKGDGNVNLNIASGGQCNVNINYEVKVSDIPQTTAITGNDTICVNSVYGYSVGFPPVGVTMTYAWSVTGGQILGSSTNRVINVKWASGKTGSVSVVETNSDGCVGPTKTKNIVLLGSNAGLNIVGNANVCANSKDVPYTFELHQGSTYSWKVEGGSIVNPNSGNSIKVNWGSVGNGKVKLVETSVNGCISDTVVLSVVKSGPVTSGITGRTNVCTEEKNVTYSVINNPNSTYAWKVTGGSIKGSNTGNTILVDFDNSETSFITVVESSNIGCLGDSVKLEITKTLQPIAAFEMPDSVDLDKDPVVTFNNNSQFAETYLWDFGDGSPKSTEQAPQHTYTKPGTYNVKLIVDNFVCRDSISKTILCKSKVFDGVNENYLSNKIHVFPIPAKSALNIHLDNLELENILILDSRSQVIKVLPGTIQKNLIINIDQLSDGMYYLQMKTNRGLVYKKFIVQK